MLRFKRFEGLKKPVLIIIEVLNDVVKTSNKKFKKMALRQFDWFVLETILAWKTKMAIVRTKIKSF